MLAEIFMMRMEAAARPLSEKLSFSISRFVPVSQTAFSKQRDTKAEEGELPEEPINGRTSRSRSKRDA